MAATAASNQKKMEYKRVSFDVNEIAPDAPAGEWGMSIPRGKCKVQPTREDRYPMLIIPIRLDSTEDEDEIFQKALGAELSIMIVFFGDEKARAARMSKIRLRQICEHLDIDLDIVPKEIEDPENDLEPLIRELENKGRKFTGWTIVKPRKDTGEETTEVVFLDPNKKLSASDDDEDEDEDEDEEEAPAPKRTAAKKKTASSKGAKKK